MGWKDAPIAQPPSVPQQPAAPRKWETAPSVDDTVRAMSREQMIDYYRTSKKGDPVADRIEQVLSQPLEGESPEDTERRLYGHMDNQFSGPGALAAGWADGAATGGADELAGGISALTGGGYDQGVSKAREALRVAGEEHPWWYNAGTVLGGLTQGLATGLGPAQSVQTAAPQVMSQFAVRSGPSLLGRIGTGAAVGGGQGGLYSFLSGEGGFTERMKRVPMGAGIGAAFGAAFPAVSAGIGALRGRWTDKGLDQKALGKVADMLDSTTMSADEAANVASQQGNLGMIADVNPGMQQATGGTSAAGGAGVIGPRLSYRREGAKDRVGKYLDDTFGSYIGPQAVKEAVADARAPAGPAYELAKQHVVDPEDALTKIDDLLKTYSPKSPLGSMLQGYRGQLVDDAGNVIGQGNIVHGVREQLDDQINKLYRAGEGKAAGRLKEVRQELDKVLKGQIPGFAEADQLWSETAKVDEAYRWGKDEVLGRIHPGEVEAKLKGMPYPENAAARAGVRDEIEMRMAQPGDPARRAERIIEQNMNREKLAGFTTPQRADVLARNLDNEATFMETSNLAEPSRQSRTAPVSAAAQRWWGTSPGKMSDAITDIAAGTGAGMAIGGPHGAMVGGAAAATSKARELIANVLSGSGPSPELINKTADLLTRQGAARDKVIENIMRRAEQKMSKAAAGKRLDLIIRTLLRGLPGVAADAYLDLREQNTGER